MSLGICGSDLLFLCSPHSFQMRMHHRVFLCVDLGTAAFLASATALSDSGAAKREGGAGFSIACSREGGAGFSNACSRLTSSMNASIMSSVSLSDSGYGSRLQPLGTTKSRRRGVSGHAPEDILIVRDSTSD